MSDNDKFKKLYEVVANQQKIIGELVTIIKKAQAAAPVAAPHRDEVTHGLSGTQKNPTSGHQPPPQSISAPTKPRFDDADSILKALPPLVRAAVKTIQVQPSRDPNFDAVVKVLFNPGKGTNAAFAMIQKVVTTLQQQNVLQGSNYQIQQVA